MVSVATVSRTYNAPETVCEATRNKVLQAAKTLNYAPHLAARALSLHKTNIIGVILPDLDSGFFSELLQSIDQVAWQYGYHIMISASHSQRNEADILLRLMGQGWVDGLILMVPVLGRISSSLLSQANIPLVLLNLPDSSEPVIQINVDNFRGAYLITKHLIEHHYWPIAMIRGPVRNYDADRREQGYRAALEEHQLPVEENGVTYIERGDFKRRSGFLAMIQLLSLPLPPRAVFAANDEMAIGAISAARQSGVRVPEQLAIVGFDDIDVVSCIRPALTTVHLPISELGTTAAEKLITAIENREPHLTQSPKIVLPTGLIIRESCGCVNQNRYELNEGGR